MLPSLSRPPQGRVLLTSLLAASLGGCITELVTIAPDCSVEISAVEPGAGEPGSTVLISASPLTSDFDTAVTFGPERAEITSLDRVDCGDCDECRSAYSCSGCGDCPACDLTCDSTCDESITVVLPAGDPGNQPLRITNSHGSSGSLDFELLEGSATPDTGDTGDTDSGSGDSGNGGSDTALIPDTGGIE